MTELIERHLQKYRKNQIIIDYISVAKTYRIYRTKNQHIKLTPETKQ